MKRFLVACILILPLFSIGQVSCSSTTYTGTGTYYTSSGLTSCSFDTNEVGSYYCAMNQPQYNTASYCGTCLQVTGQAGSHLLIVNDLCSSCASGSLDMSPNAFQAIVGNLGIGSGNISWQEVPCPYSGLPLLLTNVLSNPWYVYFLIHHATNELASVEIFTNSAWVPLTRTQDNHWQGSINGDTLLNVRIKDIYGGQVLINAVNMNITNQAYLATTNFIPCVTTDINAQRKTNSIKIIREEDNLKITSPAPFYFVEIVDITGKKVHSINLEKITTSYQLPTATLPNGAYILTVLKQNETPWRITFIK